MFEGKTLIAAGDSHTYGQYLYDDKPETCHERSWVKKLETLGMFDKSVNLARNGCSNDRILRVVYEYVERNYKTIKDSVIIIAFTDAHRFELPSIERAYFRLDESNHESYLINSIMLSNMPAWTETEIAPQFIETYFKYFYVEQYTLKMLNQKIVGLSSLLTRLGVEHYFTDFLTGNTFFEEPYMGMTFPYLKISENNPKNITINLRELGFKVGKDFDESSFCNHYDHDGNQFIAECFLRDIKKWRERDTTKEVFKDV
jgi:hypothetical protein